MKQYCANKHTTQLLLQEIDNRKINANTGNGNGVSICTQSIHSGRTED